MAAPSTDVIQGTLDMLILKSLSLQPMHGFGITQRIEQISKGVFRVNAGSLLLAFQRLERAGLIDSEWRPTENNRRGKYYSLTKQGRRHEEPQAAARVRSMYRAWSDRAAEPSRVHCRRSMRE